MDKRQETYLSMTNKTIGEIKREKEILKANKIVRDTVVVIDDLVVEIEETDAIKLETSKGYTIKKKEFRNKLNISTDVFFGIFRSFGKTTGDEVLYENSKRSMTEIGRIKDSEIIITVNATSKYATKHLDELADYGMEEKMIEEYGKEAQGYINYSTTPQQLAARKKAATAKLVDLFTDLDIQFLEHLDNHMSQYKTKNPDFYAIYLNVREIYDLGSFALTLFGFIGDEETKEGIDQAAVTIIRAVEGKEIILATSKTTEKGNFQIKKKIEEGMATVKVECPNYDTWTGLVRFIDNKVSRLDVELRKKE